MNKKHDASMSNFTAEQAEEEAASTSAAFPLEGKVLGFLGCGKISSAVCRGYASLYFSPSPSPSPGPAQILVSRRSECNSARLVADFPGLVSVEEQARELVRRCDVLFVGLLPAVAREELPVAMHAGTHFDSVSETETETQREKDSQRPLLVISMMAAVNFETTVSWLTQSQSQSHCRPVTIVRTVPLPSACRRTGPILMYPPNEQAERILRLVGTPVVCSREEEMLPMIAITGHISSFYELMRTSESFAVANGVSSFAAHDFVTSFYSCLASGAEQSSHDLDYLRVEAATPGGLNEQSINFLQGSPHFDLQHEVAVFGKYTRSIDPEVMGKFKYIEVITSN